MLPVSYRQNRLSGPRLSDRARCDLHRWCSVSTGGGEKIGRKPAPLPRKSAVVVMATETFELTRHRRRTATERGGSLSACALGLLGLSLPLLTVGVSGPTQRSSTPT
jgi:hypothetical protein